MRIGDYRVIFDYIDSIIFIKAMEIVDRFIKECDFMTATKERIIGAVSIMSDKDADIFWPLFKITLQLLIYSQTLKIQNLMKLI